MAHASNNILLIIADDYGIDGSSLYNTSPTAVLPPTPNIAALAANGVRFTRVYACPVLFAHAFCHADRTLRLSHRHRPSGIRVGE